MLDFLRKRKRNWVIILFLGAIIVSFSLFVGSGKIGGPLGGEVADINGEPISQREFAMQYEREIQRYRELLREEVAHTVATAADIDDEVRHLVSVLRGT